MQILNNKLMFFSDAKEFHLLRWVGTFMIFKTEIPKRSFNFKMKGVCKLRQSEKLGKFEHDKSPMNDFKVNIFAFVTW